MAGEMCPAIKTRLARAKHGAPLNVIPPRRAAEEKEEEAMIHGRNTEPGRRGDVQLARNTPRPSPSV
ncbi:hypothetical protein EYF80_059415 [Liparis tanakae]|uniref:Uncharacterized protein n=1 Tax=Liparis tanakae TaxID=230148 RepID=A0A4Z2ENR3_9TELE|nr:hypothetical protein EYF80_059415 [Liparis tanakae]